MLIITRFVRQVFRWSVKLEALMLIFIDFAVKKKGEGECTLSVDPLNGDQVGGGSKKKYPHPKIFERKQEF